MLMTSNGLPDEAKELAKAVLKLVRSWALSQTL